MDGTAYDTFDLKQDADQSAIKKRYHALARAWHPDVSKQADADKVFAHVSRSYDILRKPEERQMYDFVLANRLPRLHLPEVFEHAFMSDEGLIPRRRLLFWMRHKHSVAGLFAATLASVPLLWRGNSLRAASEPPAPQPSEAPSVGGLAGGASGTYFALAMGARGGGRLAGYTFAAACGGALLGRAALPGCLSWVESRIGAIRLLRERGARLLVANGRQACELAGAGVAVLLVLRGSPSMRLATSPLRSLAVGGVGAVAGHGVGRAACHDADVAAASAPPRRSEG